MREVVSFGEVFYWTKISFPKMFHESWKKNSLIGI